VGDPSARIRGAVRVRQAVPT